MYFKDWEKHFLDAGASKPSDWNSELDGDWQAPMLQKPPYQVCGLPPVPSSAAPSPPASLGTSMYGLLLQDGLKPEGIEKDVWLHQKMKNTNYLTEYDLSEFENIGAIGLELWQVTGFLICFSLITLNFSLNSLIRIAVIP